MRLLTLVRETAAYGNDIRLLPAQSDPAQRHPKGKRMYLPNISVEISFSLYSFWTAPLTNNIFVL